MIYLFSSYRSRSFVVSSDSSSPSCIDSADRKGKNGSAFKVIEKDFRITIHQQFMIHEKALIGNRTRLYFNAEKTDERPIFFQHLPQRFSGLSGNSP